MRLITFVDRSARSHIGALAQDGRIVDLNAAHKLNSGDEALLAADMRALFEGGDRSLDAARAALAHAESQRAAEGADGDPVFYRREDVHLKAPIVPKKFFHRRQFSRAPSRSWEGRLSHPVPPWIMFFQNVDAIIGPDEPVIFPPT